MKTELNISNAEWIIMRIIWSLGQARADEIEHQIPESSEWSLATIKTLLGRLVKKEMLYTEKEGRKFIYKPLIEECQAIQLMGENLLSKVCATKQVLILEKMIELATLTEEETIRLSHLLKHKTTTEDMECTCLENKNSCICTHEK
ncbi:MAG: CopY/TcrY family copper transport repressor [Streptococcaceae bacterium]|nr:CopY/TcrY family copper transport repressor [Streptococcaceae bacterium]